MKLGEQHKLTEAADLLMQARGCEELKKMASLISLSPFPQPIAEEPHETYEVVEVLIDSNAPFKSIAESENISPLHLAPQDNKRMCEDRDSSIGKIETQEVELTDE
jgi:hypothetical protein